MLNHHQNRSSLRRPTRPEWASLLIVALLGLFHNLSFSRIEAAEQATNILILKSGSATVYNQVVADLRNQFDRLCKEDGLYCKRLTIQSYITNESKPLYQSYDLVVTLGLKARQYALHNLTQSKTINALIPSGLSIFSQRLPDPVMTPTLLLDQPIERSLRLIKRVIPSANEVGMLISQKDLSVFDELSRLAEQAGLTMHAEIIDSEQEIGKKLSLLLNQVDVLVSQPDVAIYNRGTVSQILLSSYRKHIPVFGFSSAYVEAGAFAAVFSSPTDLAKQIADSIRFYLDNKTLEAGRHFPTYFSVSINQKVGHSLGIQLDADTDEIIRYIKEGEQ